jgi:hypothetical protein
MIKTQYISSTTDKPIPIEGFVTVNVLKWKNSKWKEFSPYYLRTDGNERVRNDGGVLFENYYQGCKIYDVVHSIKVYASRFHYGKEKYLWWDYSTVNEEGDVLFKNDEINYDLYYRWRNSLWGCQEAIRYPNGIHRRKNTQFSLYVDKKGREKRLGYIESRKKIYAKEYIRLVTKLDKYQTLLNHLKEGKNLLICEVDVPKNGKNGEYGVDCDDNNSCDMSLAKIETLLEDPRAAFGHGLCLAYSLLCDLEKFNKSK